MLSRALDCKLKYLSTQTDSRGSRLKQVCALPQTDASFVSITMDMCIPCKDQLTVVLRLIIGVPYLDVYVGDPHNMNS